jgi:hypothetical protein
MMNLKPEYVAMLNADKIPVEQVFRLKMVNFLIQKADGSGRVRMMIRQTYANGVTKYERITGIRPGIVKLSIWGTDLPMTETEIGIDEVN